jgi:hypothetical protein
MKVNRLLNIPLVVHAQMLGDNVVDFLNGGKDYSEDPRIVEVFNLCSQLGELRKTQPLLGSPAWWGYETEKKKLLDSVNHALAEYHFTPQLDLSLLGAHDRFSLRWISARKTKFKDPAWILQRILEMTQQGSLDRVRKCICGRWFFAATKKKEVCSDACRFRKFQEGLGPAFKEERRKYMQKYYRRKAKAKNAKKPK